MTIKQTLKNLGTNDVHSTIIDRIDFNRLEKFVDILLNGIIKKYSKQKVEQEIEMDKPDSEISTFLTHIIEVGGLKIISENKLPIASQDQIVLTALVVSLALNVSLSNELQAKGVYRAQTPQYYHPKALQLIIARLVNHVIQSDPESEERFEYWANEMVKFYLFNKL